MSSTTNATITPAPPPVDVAVTAKRDINLGQLLGMDGCKLFSQELSRLAAEEDSGWSRHSAGQPEVFVCSINQGLPPGIPSLKVQLSVSPGVIEVQQHWTLQGLEPSRPEVPQAVRKAMQQIVNRAVNQPLVRVVAGQIKQKITERPPMSTRLQQELRVWQRSATTVQLHARLRQGASR